MTLQDYFIENAALRKEWAPDLNTERVEDLKPHSRGKVWWRCGRGHQWQASPNSRVYGKNGCPYCFGRLAIPGSTDLATTHPEHLARWSPRNSLSPGEVTAGSHKRVWWVCEKGHEWESSVVSYVTEDNGCPYCSGRRAIPGETDLATLRPELMDQWDYERNTLDPCRTTVGSHDKAWWKCSLGHSWQAAVFSRTKEKPSGCPYCTGKLVLTGFNDLATLRPRLAQQWHQPLNGGLTPDRVTLGSNRKVWWECSEGHVWMAYIFARTKPKGTGCPVCTGTVRNRGRKTQHTPAGRSLRV